MSECITFKAQAYCKIILHATKYPHCAVNGVLLAKVSTKSKEITFEDAVPLFHIGLNLTPMAEVALAQIDELVSKKGLCIAGYYTAHENLRENSFEKSESRITDKLASNFNHPCLVVVDNMQVGTTWKSAIKVAQFSDGSYRPCDPKRVCVKPEKTFDICNQLNMEEKYYTINDFDDHLDDIKLDWLNPAINEAIEGLL
ncbi:ER membrane protein complex subunit 8 [Coccinella septempunctata]|uniref:ER membrane protein complex subunit 8 n=1 Tax=Coccinella septempunctata TaxID=41139 RepID=UPI001D08AD12|nr:ER membrane protein complex subunit 8 [Coccinella septempunctata]